MGVAVAIRNDASSTSLLLALAAAASTRPWQFTFEDVTEKAGVRRQWINDWRGLGDYDRDGFVDLLFRAILIWTEQSAPIRQHKFCRFKDFVNAV